ncbi:MAG: ABC transporter permease [Proteobacteria bacterium]|nr:ABC transporter permease [Pseudomonadota bacterium]
MPLEWRLAWRNVWRNPRRTGLSVAATVFAVVLVMVAVAMAAGTHEKMIEDSVRLQSGHVLVAGEDYLERRTLEQFVRFDAELEAILDETPGVRAVAPRVSSYGLVSHEDASQGVAVIGVDPEREAGVTTLAARVYQGDFLAPDGARQMVVGRRLAQSLGVGLGDEVLLYGAAYSLETAYELFRIRGVLALPDPELERRVVFISLADAQEFYVFGDRVSEIALLASDSLAAPAIRDALNARLAERGAVAHTWDEVLPELEQLILLDDAGMYIMLAILVVVVGFGILNTILMAVLERTRELGVVLALGLSPGAVFRMVYLESLLLAGVGLVVGLGIALPLVLYFQAHPIPLGGDVGQVAELFGMEPVITWKLRPGNPVGSVLTILGVAVAAALYPAVKASRGRPVDALRSL